MESPTFIRAAHETDSLKETVGHERAVSFFETHRELYERYAGYAITVKPAPEGLDTFAFDLKTNTIYLNDKFYALLGYPEEGTSFATFHEIEHFREKLALLNEHDGARVFERYLERLDEKISPHAGAYGVMDNCISDVRQNGAVVARNHEGFDTVEKRLYRDVQFPDVDFTSPESRKPLHVQLSYAILNEYRSGRHCVVDERVRAVLDDLQHVKLPDGREVDILALMTNPDPNVAPMSKRLCLQDAYVWPRVLELLEEDLAEEKEKRTGKGAGGDSRGEGEEGAGAPNPNEIFKDAYEEAKTRVPNAVPISVQKEALTTWIEENGDSETRALRDVAERIGVKPEDVRTYKNIARELHRIDPKTNESVIDELEHIIRRIVSRRLKEHHAPKHPVEEGDELVDPAEWLAEVRSGNFEPKVWEDTEIKLKKENKFGEVEITLVCDRSGSMKGPKQREQQKALVLFMEALKRFNDILDNEEMNVEKPLSIKSEIYTFQADADDAVPVKRMGKVLSEKERIVSCTKVSTTPGKKTTDFVPLEAIQKGLGHETKEKIREGELKKIVIVFTDGDSSDSTKVRDVCAKLRAEGVMVIGVGITHEGKSALTTYAPDAMPAEKAEDIPLVLKNILKDVLADV